MGLKKFSEDETYFEKINTPEKAYILGFFYADASVLERNPARVRIRISVKDRDFLEFILKKMKSDRIIKEYLVKNGSMIADLTINSVKIVDDLIALGCTQNKRNTIKFPNEDQVPRKYIYDFLLGYFDGDGSISLGTSGPRFDLTAPGIFLNEYINFLPKDVSNGYKIRPEHGGQNLKTYLCGYKNNLKLGRALYGKSQTKFYLLRKQENFLKIAEHLNQAL
jgi:hypothetical protein